MVLFVFAHGAGASSSSDWMVRWAKLLRTFGTVHAFDYEYMKRGGGPGKAERLVPEHAGVVRAAVAKHKETDAVVLVGKSMGSRVGCHVAAEDPSVPLVKAVMCFGYPLVGGNGKMRDEVLRSVPVPTLFLAGTRDKMCPVDKLQPIADGDMPDGTSVFVVDGGNHSLETTKKACKDNNWGDQDGCDAAMLEAIRDWLEAVGVIVAGAGAGAGAGGRSKTRAKKKPASSKPTEPKAKAKPKPTPKSKTKPKTKPKATPKATPKKPARTKKKVAVLKRPPPPPPSHSRATRSNVKAKRVRLS